MKKIVIIGSSLHPHIGGKTIAALAMLDVPVTVTVVLEGTEQARELLEAQAREINQGTIVIDSIDTKAALSDRMKELFTAQVEPVEWEAPKSKRAQWKDETQWRGRRR